MLPLVHVRVWFASSVLVVAVVIVASLVPGSAGPDTGQLDKLGHFLAYAALAAWFGGIFARDRYWAIALGLTLLGIGLEVLQELVATNRTGDPNDVAANVVGLLAGLALSWWRTGGWALRMESWLERN
jgi:VanZ family protein